MKKTLFVTCLLLACSTSADEIDVVKERLSGSGIKAADWYTKGDTEFADVINKYMDTRVALNGNKGMATVEATNSVYTSTLMGICYSLTDIVPHKKSNGTWESPKPPTQDEQVIRKLFAGELPYGQENSVELNGWSLKYTQLSALKFECAMQKI